MRITETGESPFPKDVQAALAREPIVLGVENIGTYFRNEAEITDLRELIAQTQDGAVAIGLAGSRLRGKFSYPAEELFNRLCLIFPGFVAEIAQLSEEEQDDLSDKDSLTLPERFTEPFQEITAFLDLQQSSNTNIGNIDLSKLPSHLQDLIKFSPYDAGLFFPRDEKARSEYWTRTFLTPGFYFPDIDLVVISTDPKKLPEFNGLRRKIGPRSGVRIELVPIDPFSQDEDPLTVVVEALNSMVANFRPLSISV